MGAVLKISRLLLVLAVTLEGSCLGAKRYTSLHKWFKVACIAEHLKETDHYICDKHGHVNCLPGWSNEKKSCKVPVCHPKCVYGQGNCTAPNTCTCHVGWTGANCSTCVCLPGCVNGYCKLPFECICKPGWHGMLCDKPVCKKGCKHGHCTVPGECICHPGWKGEHCDICQPLPGCSTYGYCEKPMECKCRKGYKGNFCHESVCTKGCHPQYGFCTKPYECWCRPGWHGGNCTQCVKYPGCVHGVCEGPWECNCNHGWSGQLCDKKGYETTTVHALHNVKNFHDHLFKVQGNHNNLIKEIYIPTDHGNLFKDHPPTKKFKRNDDVKDAPINETNYHPSFEDVLPGFRTGEQTPAETIETTFDEPPPDVTA